MGVIDFEFVGADINISCIEKVFNANAKNAGNALFDLSIDIPIEFANSAMSHGSMALSNPFLYDAETDLTYGFSGQTSGNIGSITVDYNQDRLSPSVGSDRVRDSWIHTSPISDNPNDYSEVVNAHKVKILDNGRSICNFNPPAWSYYGNGYKDEVVDRLPEIVSKALSRYGIIHKN